MIFIEQKYMNSIKELQFADLPKNQEERLRDLEKQFNNEFNQDFYFMVMKRGEQTENRDDMLP